MKSRNLTQSSLRNDPINLRMQGYSFQIFKDKDGVQDVNSSFSFNQILILSIQMTRKWVKNTLEQTARELEFHTERIWRLIANTFFRREERFYKWRNRSWAIRWSVSSDWRSRSHVIWSKCRVVWWTSDRDRVALIWSEARWISTVIIIKIDGQDDFT